MCPLPQQFRCRPNRANGGCTTRSWSGLSPTRTRLSSEVVYPSGLIEDAVGVAQQVEAFWAWYMVWGHCQGAALDLSQADHRVWLDGDAVDQLMYAHHRFWQERLPVWQNVWNREFETARDEQRNKLIYLDALRELDRGVDPVGPSTLLYNPADETSVWRYWGPIVRPVPNPTAPQTVRGTDTARRHPWRLRPRTRRPEPPSTRELGLCASGTSRRPLRWGSGTWGGITTFPTSTPPGM